ncbi:MAG: transposase [Chloroflexi bacterium]|nr:transposase [Chloroflexota bacterium]
MRLFVLPPRSPKLNGHMERAQRTHTEELYEVWDLPWTFPQLSQKLRAGSASTNTPRPHQALGYRTPRQYLRELAHAGKG